MSTALFVRHRAKPGCRDDVRRIWEKHVRPRAAANPAHLAYCFCFDDADAGVVCVFQLYASREAMAGFLSGEWYPSCLAKIAEVVTDPPQVMPARLVWQKGAPGLEFGSHEAMKAPTFLPRAVLFSRLDSSKL